MDPMIHSSFLRDLDTLFRSELRKHTRFDVVEFETESADSIMDERWDVFFYTNRVYLTLAVWGDQVAIFSVRENCKKRLDKRLLFVEEFPLIVEPRLALRLFLESTDQAQHLGYPPGTPADQGILDHLEELWLDCSLPFLN